MGTGKKERQKTEREKVELVNGINKEKIDRYQQLEEEETKEKSNHESLSVKLAEAETQLEAARRTLQECQSSEQSRDITTIDAIQACREATDNAAQYVRDCQKVSLNLKTALQNAESSLRRTSEAKAGSAKHLFRLKKDLLVEEIHRKVGDLISDYLLCVISSIPGINPSAIELIPKEALRLLTPGVDQREKRQELFENILNGK